MPKNIIICCDGTNNKFGDRNSNVVKIAQLSLYQINDPLKDQIVYYDPGVGTLNLPTDTQLQVLFSKVFGEGFGYGVDENIRDAYTYLMDNYETGDQVYLFGFSRGAYTVRALAGLLHIFGLLRKGSLNLVPYVSEMYHKYKDIKDIQSIASRFKASFCQECKPHFIGVFDTVEAMGKYYKRAIFTDASLNPDIKHAYHALSIDESRRPFKPFLWDETKKEPDQVIEQVWFAGDHSDIGGGHLMDDLSDIALKWMLTKAESAGVLLKQCWEDTLLPNVKARVHDLYNFWWGLSGIYYDGRFGRMKRIIPPLAKIHMSVKERMNEVAYKPELPLGSQFVE